MNRIREYVSGIFNLDKRKQPYSPAQIAGILAIVVLLFPLVFSLLGFLAVPLASLIELLFEPRDQRAVAAAKAVVYTVKIILGMSGGVWMCRMVWPRRKSARGERDADGESHSGTGQEDAGPRRKAERLPGGR